MGEQAILLRMEIENEQSFINLRDKDKQRKRRNGVVAFSLHFSQDSFSYDQVHATTFDQTPNTL